MKRVHMAKEGKLYHLGVAAAAATATEAATTPKKVIPPPSVATFNRGDHRANNCRRVFPFSTGSSRDRAVAGESDRDRDRQIDRHPEGSRRARPQTRRMSENSLLELLLGAEISIRFTACLRCAASLPRFLFIHCSSSGLSSGWVLFSVLFCSKKSKEKPVSQIYKNCAISKNGRCELAEKPV